MIISDLYKGKTFPVFTCSLVILCLVISIPTYLFPELHSVFALWPQPDHLWQYLTFVFEHGIEPRWIIWVHLVMNLLGLIPFGILAEKVLSSKRLILLFVIEWLVTIIIFKMLRNGQHTSVTGISSIVYAYAAVSSFIIFKAIRHKRTKIYLQPLAYYFAFELFGMVTMLNPLLTGWVSFWIHFSGIAIGLLLAYVNKKTINDYILSFCIPVMKN